MKKTRGPEGKRMSTNPTLHLSSSARKVFRMVFRLAAPQAKATGCFPFKGETRVI